MNEEEVRTERSGAQMMYHGLENFPEKFKRSVQGAMTLVKSWLRETIPTLESSKLDPFTNQLMMFTFGIDYSLVHNAPDNLKQQLLGTLRELDSYIQRLSSDESWRLSLVDTNGPTFFRVTIPSSTQGNLIWMNRSLIEERHQVGLAKTIAHEGFHAMRDFASRDFIADFWYVGQEAPLVSASKNEVEDYSFGVEYSFTTVANGTGSIKPPDESDMSPDARQHYVSLIDGHLANSGKTASVSSDERANIYRQVAGARQSVVLKNADSLAVLLMTRYRPT